MIVYTKHGHWMVKMLITLIKALTSGRISRNGLSASGD